MKRGQPLVLKEHFRGSLSWPEQSLSPVGGGGDARERSPAEKFGISNTASAQISLDIIPGQTSIRSFSDILNWMYQASVPGDKKRVKLSA